MFGGAGADTFVFRSTTHSSASASGADIIRDFTRGVDKIDLHFIDASTKLSGNNAFTFDGTSSFGHQIRAIFTTKSSTMMAHRMTTQ